MSPDEREKMEKLEQQVEALLLVQDVPFIENMKRRLDISSIVATAISNTNLTELFDVDTDGVTNGQVIKFTSSSSTWENANDIDT